MSKRISKRTRIKNRSNHMLTGVTYQGKVNVPTQVELVQYNNSEIEIKSISRKTSFHNEMRSDRVNWFKTKGISDVDYINEICKNCGLHGFDIRDIMSNQQVAKVVTYEKVTFILLPGFSVDEHNELDVFQIGFILGQNFIISLQESDFSLFDNITNVLNINGSVLRQNGVDYLLYILLNEVNELDLTTIFKIEDQLLDLEDLLLAQDSSINIMTHLSSFRIAYIKMRRSMLAIREEYNNLQRNTNKLIKEGNMVYFNDFDDKLRTTLTDLEACHELLSSLLDLYYSNTNLRMNEIMKRLTIVSTIFIPLTFLVGVWGMNFDIMPELKWKYGYLVAWGIFAAVFATILYIMKKKKWF